MVANLFSSFDPSSSLMIPLNWMSSFLGMTITSYYFWLIPYRTSFMLNKVLTTLLSEFKILLGVNTKGMTLMFIVLFLFILYNSFLGMFPYLFTSTSHLAFTLTMALPLWISFMLFGWINNTIHMLAHFVPQGTPAALMPFMVLIETVSNIIRPGTLAVRLAANMIAGHLLMTLLGNTSPSLSLMMMHLLLISQLLLIILELAVAIIQSYVFAVLSTWYSSEVI